RLEPLRERGLGIPFENARGNPVHHVFPVLVPEGTDRDGFRRALHAMGVQTSMHYPRLDRFAHVRGLFDGTETPIWNGLVDRLVTLPMGPTITDEQIEIVGECVEKALD